MKSQKFIAAFLCVLTIIFSVSPAYGNETYAAGNTSSEAKRENDKIEKPEEVVCTKANETVGAIFDGGYTGGEIHIAKAEYTSGGETREIFFISLMGMCFIKGKTNDWVSAVKSAFNLKSSYFRLAKEHILENVESGSAIIFCGHSLGGMVCQQFRADRDITENYEIIATLTAGSPYIITSRKRAEGSLVRLADVSDRVPYLSPALIFSRKNHNDRIIEDGGYDGDYDNAHNQSYRFNSVWDKYDALGIEGGDSEISFMNKDVLTFSSDKK